MSYANNVKIKLGKELPFLAEQNHIGRTQLPVLSDIAYLLSQLTGASCVLV